MQETYFLQDKTEFRLAASWQWLSGRLPETLQTRRLTTRADPALSFGRPQSSLARQTAIVISLQTLHETFRTGVCTETHRPGVTEMGTASVLLQVLQS